MRICHKVGKHEDNVFSHFVRCFSFVIVIGIIDVELLFICALRFVSVSCMGSLFFYRSFHLYVTSLLVHGMAFATLNRYGYEFY